MSSPVVYDASDVVTHWYDQCSLFTTRDEAEVSSGLLPVDMCWQRNIVVCMEMHWLWLSLCDSDYESMAISNASLIVYSVLSISLAALLRE